MTPSITSIVSYTFPNFSSYLLPVKISKFEMFHNLKIFFTENLVGGYSNLIFHTETNLVNDACGRAGIKTHRPRILPFQITVGVGCFPWLSYLRVYRTHKSIPGSEPQKKKSVCSHQIPSFMVIFYWHLNSHPWHI